MAAAGWIGVEPVVLLYSFASYVRYPLFQALVLDKFCYGQYGYPSQEASYCSSDQVHSDLDLKHDAYVLGVYSNCALLIPSLFATILLGLWSDRSRKPAMLLPFVGLTLQTLNDIVQATWIMSSPYWLLISDFVFGVCGGYAAVFSTCFAYSSDLCSTPRSRSHRMAVMQGAIGLGSFIGYLISGFVKRRFGYAAVFTVLMLLHVCAFTYIMLRVSTRSVASPPKVLAKPDEESDMETTPIRPGSPVPEREHSVCWQVADYFREASSILFVKRQGHGRTVVVLLLLIIAVEDLVFSGDSGISYYYLNTELNWGNSIYGVYKGISSGVTCAAILFIYPVLRWRVLSDCSLIAFGTLCKMAGYLMFAWPFANWFVFLTIAPFAFNRFIITGARTLLSRCVHTNEQGKAFACVGLLQALFALLASPVFNGLASWSSRFFPGLPYVVMAALLTANLVLSGWVRHLLGSLPSTVEQPARVEVHPDAEAATSVHDME